MKTLFNYISEKLTITKNTPKEKIEAINKHVIEKLEEFCSKIDVSLDYLLVTIFSNY